MPISIFSDSWAAACARVLNQSQAYREAAIAWEATVLLVMTPDKEGEERGVFFDLWRGECRTARAGGGADESLAQYVLTGSQSTWRQVLSGDVAPLLAVMTGRLRLIKGSLVELLPYSHAAKELLAAAAGLEAEFPQG
jgi:putative sterol carrier protein